ncbi:hypothetical protein EVAR_100618_1 [Eumeta japonica]|uniref:Uncharacterized protein n=1 Tax=Eumeta variegata TaxID=151549 RepID=A0A4C1ZD33_EUMVA|nr:hypothetical protein EVAR_100618_1 [Eumeta japonica]
MSAIREQLDRNRISDRGRSAIMEGECGDGRSVGLRIESGPPELSLIGRNGQRKLLLHICIQTIYFRGDQVKARPRPARERLLR